MTSKQEGFTLTELSLAVTFIGTLVVMATLTIVQCIGIYNKGVALKQMNQIGRSIVDDLGRLSTGGLNLRVDDNGNAGYLCVDQLGTSPTRAYVWNSQQLGSGTEGGTRTTSAGGKYTLSGSPLKFARTNSSINGTGYCTLPPVANTAVPVADFTQLAGSQVRMLSVDIAAEGTGTSTSLRKITFWLGTYSGTASQDPVWNSTAKTWSCSGGSLGSFCAVSKYQAIVYTPNVAP